MQSFNFSTLKKFLRYLRALDLPRRTLLLFLLLLSFLYPGHNSLQVLGIKSGPITSYQYDLFDLADYPLSDGTPPPSTSGYGVIVQDLAGKSILYSYGQDLPLLPASTTKLMTALVALDEYELDEVVVITKEDSAIGHTMGLIKGEEISVRSLLYGLLVESGNDAALALATHHNQGYSGFVEAMNQKAADLHLDSTSYRNPSGVESYGHVTTPRDLATLAAHALTNDLIREIVSTTSITISDTKGEYTHRLENTNLLLGNLEGVKGMKTGWTERAGECLITYVERDGRGVIIVVLGSSDRFGDTTALVNWVYNTHTWVKPQ